MSDRGVKLTCEVQNLAPKLSSGRNSPMRRLLISQRHARARFGLTLRFARHQHFNPPGQLRDLALLARHNVRQLFTHPLKMRELFFLLVQPF